MKNTVIVSITTELGCNPTDDEYLLHIDQFTGRLDICSHGGVDDISLIQECIANHLDEIKLPAEGVTSVELEESGEHEDVFWHKYYIVKSSEIILDHSQASLSPADK